MTLYEKLFIIWLISGLVYSFYFIFIKSVSDEWEDKVRDLVWNTGFSEDFIYQVAVITSFVFGMYYVLIKIFMILFSIKEQ